MKMSLNVSSMKIIADPKFALFALENKYRFNCRVFAYFAKSQDFLFQAEVELYLGGYEEGTTFKIQIYCMKIHIDYVFFTLYRSGRFSQLQLNWSDVNLTTN
jgi:hypothetical protein